MLFLLASGWIIITIGVYTIRKYQEKRELKPAKTFAILLFLTAIWVFSVILSFVTTTEEETYFWEQFKYIGILFVPPTWMIMCIQWSGRGKWLNNKTISLTYAISTAFLLLVFTDEIHHLIWSKLEYVTAGRYLTTSVTHGIGWWFLLLYSYFLILVGNFYLIVGLTKLKHVYRKQAFVLLFSSFAPWIANALYAMGVTPLTDIDLSPAVFIITGIGILYGFSQFYLIELVPIARETVFERLHDPTIVLDTSNRVVDYTPSAQKLFIENKEIVGRNISEVLHSKSLADFLLHKKHLDTSGEVKVSINNEDKYFDAKVTPLINPHGETSGRIVSLRDITEYKKVEEKLRESEATYRSIFENTGTAMVIVEDNGVISLANTRFEKLSGYSKEELEGKKQWFEFVSEGDADKLKEYHKLRLENKEAPSSYEFQFVDRNGNIRDIYITVALIPGTRKYVASLLDITEKNMMLNELKDAHELLYTINRDLERKVKERTEEIERLIKQKDEFINQLGHDLKTPLTPMMILLPLLREEAGTEKSKELFDVVIRNVYYMKDLVSKTIELAKLNSDKIEFNMEDTYLREEVDTVIANNQVLFKENNITVINNIREDIMVYVDKLRFTELLNNLLTNAVKYMPSGGGRITIDAEEQGEMIQVSVQDTGIGMTEEQIKRIFDEFYKADSSRHNLDSSGLGLSIAKRIVEKHGGRIWAESPGKGKGSTFYFTIPRGRKREKEEVVTT